MREGGRYQRKRELEIEIEMRGDVWRVGMSEIPRDRECEVWIFGCG